ncbi:MAG: VTT domain-containing protein [Proteobacteria bacterium]|nr:VTT domain-containing protein [Pseudomonadota bacterium]MBU6425673.1 VTT domain-containing protein [Rhodospirillales bacterium]
MLRGVYDRLLALSTRPSAPLWLFLVAMAEASVFPLPPDVLLIPMALAKPRRAFVFALIATMGSVLGGAIGYGIGYALLNRLAQPIIHFYHYEAAFAAFQHKFAEYGAAIILIKGLTPIPYKIVTIAAGAAKFNFWAFMGLSFITRGSRFLLEAVLLRFFGEPARDFIENRLGLVTSLFAVLLVAGFLVLKFA